VFPRLALHNVFRIVSGRGSMFSPIRVVVRLLLLLPPVSFSLPSLLPWSLGAPNAAASVVDGVGGVSGVGDDVGVGSRSVVGCGIRIVFVSLEWVLY